MKSISPSSILDDGEMEVVEHFKYLGSLKSAIGNCGKYTRYPIGMTKKIMLDLVPIWRDRGMHKGLKMKLIRSLVWTVLTSGAECWTLTTADENRIESTELWIYLGCYESRVGLNTEQTKVSLHSLTQPTQSEMAGAS